MHRQFYQGAFRVDTDGDKKPHETCQSEHDKHESLTVGVPREALKLAKVNTTNMRF